MRIFLRVALIMSFALFSQAGIAAAECRDKPIGFFDVDENCTCNLKEKPWLGPGCEIPNPYNPDHACRIHSYIEHHGGNPLDRKLSDELHVWWQDEGDQILNLAWKNCESARQNRCKETELLRQQSFNSIVSSMVDVPIHQAFLAMATKNADIRRHIDVLSNQMQDKIKNVSTKDDAKLVNKFLMQDMQSIQSMIQELASLERQLNVLLGRLAGQLATLDARTAVVQRGFDCAKYLPSERASYSLKENDVYTLINRYRGDARAERRITSKLYNAAYFNWRYLVYKKYADSVGIKIEQAMNDLNGDLAVEQIVWQYADWWTRSSVNGLAGNLHTRYYFHSEPLRILKSLREEAVEFKESLKLFEKNNGPAVSQAYKNIDANIASIDRGISSITSKGWQGLLALQVQAANRRASLATSSQKCRKLSQSFVDSSAGIKSVDAFDKASYLYKETVSICNK
ncbi:MAG TPA: hypothetical protein VE954_00730 [Oligoflexus sp.]|uniref:hypothetical protein n=1 Tax=Oligoflexus sp. TaxID=1971216 RepID=UPI002D736D56|nr:hypothetical protein [Oligoflexus sp.]HYX31604.1 hypothetical protein [Oligoflexus sp.]